jgi:hypothetical protein
MQQLANNKATSRKARAVVSIAAALLGAAVLCQPDLAQARGGGGHGGGFHGGGFHGGGFHGGGFHGGGFHAYVASAHHSFGSVHERQQVRVVNNSVRTNVHRGVADARGGRWYSASNGRRWYHGWHGGRYGWWLTGAGLAWTYYTYPWWDQPYAGWYYCSDPAGYYPYVGQCNTGWQTVPAS